jgi:Flp pilus assembly protein protease CpaA
MIESIGLFYIIAFIAIAIASYTDIRTREVPDLLNYGVIVVAAAARIIYSIWNGDYSIALDGLLGGMAGFAAGSLMYYSGQWGGGDTKLLCGLGILIGLPLELQMTFLPLFMINILFAGAAYALVWAVVSAIIHWADFASEFAKINSGLLKIKVALLIFLAAIVAAVFLVEDRYIKLMLFALAVILVFTMYVYVFIKAVERSAMLKIYPISKLTEGDWIAKDVFVGKKYITGPKDLGITKEKISVLKKYGIKSVLVKEGIPFVPSFLIAFLLTYFVGNWITLLFRI